ncbi:MAG TPA: hydantoinase/oxoprolinase family protein [Gemmataceae bacterium]|nr:hydantoinase/oxoprolinase family protein [Gemmataceae bacterium]
MARAVLGLDIGGANLKAAHSAGAASLRPFALWKNPDGLSAALAQLIREFPPYDRLAITMTGELCDCFASKRQGMEAILAALETVAGRHAVSIWRNDGRFVDGDGARAEPLAVAAANWLALATLAGRWVPEGPALVLDIGSTTTDLVPLFDGQPIPRGRVDPERLRHRELVYTGVRRTPVCALLGPSGAAEFFATSLDVYLILGDMPENHSDCDTADGRPATRAAALARMARMVCADRDTLPEAEIQGLALRIHHRQLRLLRRAITAVSALLPAPPLVVVTAGSGEFLADKLLAGWSDSPRRHSLAQNLGPMISQCACAYALAILATEQSDDGP